MGVTTPAKDGNEKADGGATARPSLLDRMKEAGAKGFAKIGYVIDGTLIINIAMIAIGSVYLGQCPAQKYIPIYLIVGGVFGIVNNILEFVERWRYKDSDEEGPRYHLKAISLFMFAWFIAGCVWVYKIYPPDYENENSDKYCHKTLYLFTFWMFNISFIILGICLLMICCCFVWCAVCIAS